MRYRVLARWRGLRGPLILSLAGVFALLAALGGWWTYEFNPSVHFHVQVLLEQVHSVVAPHSDIAPTPVVAVIPPTFVFPASSPTPGATATPRAALDTTATATATRVIRTPTPSATPPSSVILTGFRHEYQLFNNCGPASLAIDLSYWGWPGTQKDTARFLKPNQDDKNVSPREMYEYLLTQGYDAYIRADGDVNTLKRFIAAGYPVLVEKGFTCDNTERCSGWFGHYSVVGGYDDAKQIFVLQDTFRGPNITMSYADLVANWRAFNFLYIVAFPAGPERDAEVVSLLGEAADLTRNYHDALARAQREALSLTGQDDAFAWFNVGTNLMYLKDYAGAAAAYDQARQVGLPYRMLWYQFGPYRSYYQMARYQDVVDLTTFAINSTPNPGLEEAFYWRGQAEESLGLPDQAIADYRSALEQNPSFQLAKDALAALGVTP